MNKWKHKSFRVNVRNNMCFIDTCTGEIGTNTVFRGAKGVEKAIRYGCLPSKFRYLWAMVKDVGVEE